MSETAGPFNFEPTVLAKTPVNRSGVGQRRGHKYKHSSISHQIFLEPPPRAPQALPNSLPIPTLSECCVSMSKDQKGRLAWCLCHVATAGYTLWTAHGSMAMTGLSHLLLFDALGAILCVGVDVIGNFEVWKRSSIRHPFGLERMEVLAGFALSILLFFMGADLISHIARHLLEDNQRRSHHLYRIVPGSVDVTALLAVVSTLISAFALRNHSRIGKTISFTYIKSLPSFLSNPSHILTLSCSSLLLLAPLLSVPLYPWLDGLIACVVAFSMCFLGVRLIGNLGSMLLVSYSDQGLQGVLRDISMYPDVSEVEEAKFWHVHCGLGVASIKLRVATSEDNLSKLQQSIAKMVRRSLGEGYGADGRKWEVSIQTTVEQPS
ncbi:hypothetical protein VTO42DRAFT_5976 [Malbranchea cinnamomea]